MEEGGRQLEVLRMWSWSQAREPQAGLSGGDRREELSIEVQGRGEAGSQAQLQGKLQAVEDILAGPRGNCSEAWALVAGTGPAPQVHCTQARTCCQAEDPQVPLGRICPEVELQDRRSNPALEDPQDRSCSPVDRRAHHHHPGEEDQQEQELRGDPEAGLRPSLQEGPGQGVATGSAGSGWSQPFEQASSGSGVTATDS